MNVLALSCNFRRTDISVLERISLSRERVVALYARTSLSALDECVVLSTCNRVEIYAVGNGISGENLAEILSAESNVPAAEILAQAEVFSGAEAIFHLFCVATGLDSRMVGEAEILGQVKQAYEAAFAAGKTGQVLNRIFQKSFQAAKWARTNTGVALGQISVGNVAVELAERIFGDLSRCSVLVVGTGDAGRKTAQSFVSRGAGNVLVASRNFEKARAFAAEIDAGAAELDSVSARMIHADIVVGCVSVSEPLITEEKLREILRSRDGSPLFLIDLGMPRNFPGSVSSDELWIYGLEDLAAIANENLALREREADVCRREFSLRAGRVFSQIKM